MRFAPLAVAMTITVCFAASLPNAMAGDQPRAFAVDLMHARPITVEPAVERLVIRDRDSAGRPRVLREVIRDQAGRLVNDGRFREVDEASRLVSEGAFERGARDGLWVMIVRNSAPLFRERPYSEFSGPFYSEAHFARGKLHGAWRILDANRNRISEIHFENGARHGAATWYYPNGQVMRSLRFESGLAHGRFELRDPQGVLLEWAEFERGRRFETGGPAGVVRTSRPGGPQPIPIEMVMVSPDQWSKSTLATFDLRGRPLVGRHGGFSGPSPQGGRPQIGSGAPLLQERLAGRPLSLSDQGRRVGVNSGRHVNVWDADSRGRVNSLLHELGREVDSFQGWKPTEDIGTGLQLKLPLAPK